MSRIDELAAQLASLLPPGAKELQRDLEKNMNAVLHSAFERMDLVTREQFEIQAQLLARTRAKVDTLERQVAALERHLGLVPAVADTSSDTGETSIEL